MPYLANADVEPRGFLAFVVLPAKALDEGYVVVGRDERVQVELRLVLLVLQDVLRGDVGETAHSVDSAGLQLSVAVGRLVHDRHVELVDDLLSEFGAELPGWGVASSPLIEGDLAIVQPGGRDGSVAAFDRKTGEKRWATGKNPSGYSSPIATTLGWVAMLFNDGIVLSSQSRA